MHVRAKNNLGFRNRESKIVCIDLKADVDTCELVNDSDTFETTWSLSYV